jgi:hypothetical protein
MMLPISAGENASADGAADAFCICRCYGGRADASREGEHMHKSLIMLVGFAAAALIGNFADAGS